MAFCGDALQISLAWKKRLCANSYNDGRFILLFLEEQIRLVHQLWHLIKYHGKQHILTNETKNVLDVWHKYDKKVDNDEEADGNNDMTKPAEILLVEK